MNARPRARAVATEDKEERRQHILDAVEALYLKHPDRMPSVDEVAARAGLAKGTVYLYFPSKEEMLLALHERQGQAFFATLLAKISGKARVDFDTVFALTRDHMIRVPGYIALTSRCFGMMEREIALEPAVAFKARVALLLQQAGVELERQFGLAAGEGLRLLMHSYALIVGFWQLVQPNERFGKVMDRPELRALKFDYEREIEVALRALWSGAMAQSAARKGKKR